jgi:hypothetical protein
MGHFSPISADASRLFPGILCKIPQARRYEKRPPKRPYGLTLVKQGFAALPQVKPVLIVVLPESFFVMA